MDRGSQFHILSDLPYRMSPVNMRLGGPQSKYANFGGGRGWGRKEKKKYCPCHKLNNSHPPLSLVKCGAQIFHSCYLKSLRNINAIITNRNVTMHDVHIKTSIWTRFCSTNHEV